MQAFLQVAVKGYSSLQCTASLQWLLLLWEHRLEDTWTSVGLIVELSWLTSTGSVVVAHAPSVCGIFLVKLQRHMGLIVELSLGSRAQAQ